MIRPHATSIALLGALACPGAGATTLYKCVQENGRIAYQSEACGDPARQSTLEVKSRPAADARTGELLSDKDARQAEEQAKLQLGQLMETLAGYTACVDDAPGFEARHGEAFERWKQRHATSMARFQEDSQARRTVESRIEAARKSAKPADAKARAARTDSCEKFAAGLSPAPAPSR